MNKKTILISILVVVIIAVVVGAIFLYLGRGQGGDSGEEQGRRGDFPFGIFGTRDIDRDTDQTTDADGIPAEGGKLEDGLEQPVLLLRQISTEPVAGAVSGAINGESVVRYISRSTGHVFDFFATSSRNVRVSNTTIPKISEVAWSGFDNPFLRYLSEDGETVETFAGTVVSPEATSSEGSIIGQFLPQNILSFITSKSGDNGFYLLSKDGGSRGIRTSSVGNSGVEVFTSPLSEWLLQWPAETTIVMTTKPSARVDGSVFFLNSNSGSLSWVFGGIRGLTSLASPNLSYVLYAERSGLGLYEVDTGSFSSIPEETLPEKCVWRNDGITIVCGVPRIIATNVLPDLWYQGVVSFDDILVSINTQTGDITTIVDPQDFGVSVDVFNPHIDENSGLFVFMNKKDLTLWTLQLPDSGTGAGDESG